MAVYRVDVDSAHGHRFRVTLTLERPAAAQVFSLPVWAPGSYMVRDFARHLSALSAHQGGCAVALEPLDKTRWRARCAGSAALVLQYTVYAFDPSVRGAFLDADRGFFNGSSLLLCAEGRAAEAQTLALGTLPPGWQVATAMPQRGPATFEAADYDELIDHPVALGRFWLGAFKACGVPHRFTVSGAWPSFDGARLVADAQRICETQIRFWHGDPSTGAPPFDSYLFLLHVGDDGSGGLEHRASTALRAARRDLPRSGGWEPGDGYVGLLSLISHEYFHAWNVKRLRPRDLSPPDLAREQPTQLLWFFEGFTSYYDELLLLRAGLIDAARTLRLLARTVNAVLASPGRHVQSVAAASFDAWTKLYRNDENTANATVSYYAKGALVALLCDLSLRAAGPATLDDVMRGLWRTSGGGGAIGEDDLLAAFATAGGPALQRDVHAWVHGTAELPLPQMLAGAGVLVQEEPAPLAALLGLKLSEGALSGVHVKQVLRGGAAEAAGLSAGDELLAADGWRLRRLDDARQWLGAATSFELLAVRDQRLLTLQVALPAAPAAPSVALALDPHAAAGPLALRRAWLGA